MKTDRASMAHSLEARVPFLDTAVTDLALALPTAAEGARPAQEGAAADARPSRCCRAEIVNGRKRGFSIPAAAWLRGELEPFARDVLSADTLAPPGLLPAGGGRRGCSTTTSPAART